MNRAWIPAGALAGVSVAGLIALGPLTDSLGNQVTFQPEVKTATALNPGSKKPLSEVAVSIDLHRPVGNVETAALNRGGKAKASAGTNSSDGKVTLKVRTGKSVARATTPTRPSAPTHTTVAPKATPKKTVKRQNSIGDVGESNPDQGLAAGGQATSAGEQSGTPATP